MNKNFYERITPFQNFNEITKDSHYHSVPGDWSVVLTDVRGSTKAIAEGRYKEINTVGAASIVLARKGMGGCDFPFVFGGDGATLLIPPSHLDRVLNEMSALKVLAQKNYGLTLRVGCVSVSELVTSGKKVEVAKYELVAGRCVAILRGNGISLAETKIKDPSGKYEVVREVTHEADLSGLSCRWNPIPSRRGRILSLLVMGRKPGAYENFLKKLEQIFPEGMESLNPANIDLMTYKTFRQVLSDQTKTHQSYFSKSFLFALIGVVVSIILFKLKLVNPPFIQHYTQAMRTHSDFRKFDDMLRMVIDCSRAQIAEIKKYLESAYQSGEVFYGLLETDSSLMTCYVDGLEDGQHIHFIDAENGGYAAAAVQLKAQMRAQ